MDRPHGILKNAARHEDISRKHLQWDEENIQKHEAAAGVEYGTMKIDEPKTPFQSYVEPVDADMPALELGAPLEPRSRTCSTEHLNAQEVVERLGEMRQRRVSVTSESDGDERTDEDDDDKREKHAEFERHRREHYNMRAALMRRDFDDEDEDDVGGGGGGEDPGSPMHE